MDSRKEFDRKLIDLVRGYPILYDLRKKTKYDLVEREEIWQHIGKAMAWDTDECRTRWRTIRDSYVKMHRIRDTAKGPSKSKYFVSHLKFLEILLKDKRSLNCGTTVKEEPQSPTNSKNYVDPEEVIDIMNVDEEFAEIRDCEVVLGDANTSIQTYNKNRNEINQNEEPKNKKLRVSEEPTPSAGITNGYGTHLQIVPGSPVKKSKQTVPKSPVKKAMQISPKSLDKKNTFETDSHVLTFFKSMAQIVAQFPPHFIAETRIKVCQCIGEMEVKALNENNKL